MSDGKALRFGLIGYGEVGKILSAALVEREVAAVGTWDIAFLDPALGPVLRAHAQCARVTAAASLDDLLARTDVVISAVTASQALIVATDAARSIAPGAWFLDLNSAAPGTKSRSATLIDTAGGRFVEAAVMTTVPQHGIEVPMLLGGSGADALRQLLSPLGFDMEVASNSVGVASAIKMCRSVVIKGLESLLVESLTSARAYGVEDRVLASLSETFPTLDWEALGSYLFSRTALHGKRRGEEMREVTVTVREAGLDPWMASATAQRQEWMAAQKARCRFGDVAKDANWREYADRLLMKT